MMLGYFFALLLRDCPDGCPSPLITCISCSSCKLEIPETRIVNINQIRRSWQLRRAILLPRESKPDAGKHAAGKALSRFMAGGAAGSCAATAGFRRLNQWRGTWRPGHSGGNGMAKSGARFPAAARSPPPFGQARAPRRAAPGAAKGLHPAGARGEPGIRTRSAGGAATEAKKARICLNAGKAANNPEPGPPHPAPSGECEESARPRTGIPGESLFESGPPCRRSGESAARFSLGPRRFPDRPPGASRA